MQLPKFCLITGEIKKYIEKVMGDYQNVFRDGRSVIDNTVH